MGAAAYSLLIVDRLLGYTPGARYLHDLPDDISELHAQALAASGDYFEMLASELEQVASILPIESIEQVRLQQYIGQLLYLQNHYRIVRKG